MFGGPENAGVREISVLGGSLCSVPLDQVHPSGTYSGARMLKKSGNVTPSLGGNASSSGDKNFPPPHPVEPRKKDPSRKGCAQSMKLCADLSRSVLRFKPGGTREKWTIYYPQDAQSGKQKARQAQVLIKEGRWTRGEGWEAGEGTPSLDMRNDSEPSLNSGASGKGIRPGGRASISKIRKRP